MRRRRRAKHGRGRREERDGGAIGHKGVGRMACMQREIVGRRLTGTGHGERRAHGACRARTHCT
eukprot:2791854-Prymnesium_polylepis.3